MDVFISGFMSEVGDNFSVMRVCRRKCVIKHTNTITACWILLYFSHH